MRLRYALHLMAGCQTCPGPTAYALPPDQYGDKTLSLERHTVHVPTRLWTSLLILSLVAGCTTTTHDSTGSPAPPDEPPDTTLPEPSRPEAAGRISEGPHTHDYWEGAWSLTLLDENVQVMVAHNHLFDEPPREQHTHGCDETLASDSQGGSRKFSLPEGIIVLPGTEKLSFLIDWTTPSVTGLRLLYRPANQHDLISAGVVTSGTPLDVPITPAMADAGHATRTSWVFFLCADGSAPVNTAEGSVHVNLLAARAAEIPIDPAHPDHWGERTHIELANVSSKVSGAAALNKGDAAWIHVPLEHGQLVPPGTSRIHAHVDFQDRSPTADALPVQAILYYRDSTVPEWVYKTLNLDADDAYLVVDHNMADGVYAQESNWDFWIRLSSPEPTATSAGGMSQPRPLEGTLMVHLAAEREASDSRS